MRSTSIGAGLALLALPGIAYAAAPPKGDAVHGQQVFARCMACHTVGTGPGGAMGPSLNGVVGRKAATVGTFHYSAAMQKSGLTWDAATLAKFLEAPMKTVPGTRMAFPGLSDPKDRADVITYLRQFRADGSKK